MLDQAVRSVHLRRIDPTCNMARFYALSLQPDLFGGIALVRNWGRIGTGGQCKSETFATQMAAERALARLAHMKRRRGYGDVDAR